MSDPWDKSEVHANCTSCVICGAGHCRLCGEPIRPPERALIKNYCMDPTCVTEARGYGAQVVLIPVNKSVPMVSAQYEPGDHLDARRHHGTFHE